MADVRIFTVPLDIYNKRNGDFIKCAEAQVKVNTDSEADTTAVVVACQEGIFGAVLTTTKIRRCKTNTDLSDARWHELFSQCLGFSDAVSSDVEARVRLDSYERYDSHGDLIGDELAAEEPQMELAIRTVGTLLVVYGKIALQLKSAEDASKQELADMDLLQWISIQCKQLSEEQKKNRNMQEANERIRLEVECKEREIKETINDYTAILKDLENRYYQVLNSKRRKIFELEGIDQRELDPLNETFKKKNEHNLDSVTVDDILRGEGFKAFESKRRHQDAEAKRQRDVDRDTPKRKKAKVKNEVVEDPHIKKEADIVKEEPVESVELADESVRSDSIDGSTDYSTDGADEHPDNLELDQLKDEDADEEEVKKEDIKDDIREKLREDIKEDNKEDDEDMPTGLDQEDTDYSDE